MDLFAGIICGVITVTFGLLLGGLVRAYVNSKRRSSVPVRFWVALSQIGVFFTGGVLMLLTHGRAHGRLALFTVVGAALGLLFTWLVRREQQ